MLDAPRAAGPAALLPLLRELGDLKRVRSAGRSGSIAERLFAQAWGALLAGEPPEAVAQVVAADALVRARLGDLDAPALGAVGLHAADIARVRARTLDVVAGDLGSGLHAWLLAGLNRTLEFARPPDFVAALAAQPRAGATCPDRPRVILEPAENHAEHCLMVAAYGVLLAPQYGADPVRVFVASLAHHLHNAVLPDAGFTGEVLLGDALEPAFAAATEIALRELPATLAATVREARTMLPDAATPDGRAFHAADTLDRVLQLDQHLRAGRITLRFLLEDMALVHAGPVKPFQDALLAECGLA